MTTIILSGTVSFNLDDELKPLPESKVRAVNHATQTEHHILTDTEGKFIFTVAPGHWSISVSRPDYIGSVPVAYEKSFTETEERLDFVLSPAASLAGTVTAAQDRERLADAVVKAIRQPAEGSSTGRQTRFTGTDDDGDYHFHDLQPGTWTICVSHENYFSSPQRSIVLGAGETKSANFALHAVSGVNDRRWGWSFLFALGFISLALVVTYYSLHNILPSGVEPKSPALMTLIKETEAQLAELVSNASSTTGERENEGIDSQIAPLSNNEPLIIQIYQIKLAWSAIASTFTPDDREVIDTIIQSMDAALAENKLVALQQALASFEKILASSDQQNYFWTEAPGSFVEVGVWATFGVLSFLIGKTAWYLRWNKFYREGIALHLSQLFTVPLMALVASWLLSLFNLTLELGNNQVQLDLSDPRLLAALAFVLGFQPWDLTGFLSQTSGRIIGRNGNHSR